MRLFLSPSVLAVVFLAAPCLAADPAPTLLAAHGTVEKVEKDTLTIKPRGADGKFGKALVLHLTGTSKVTTLTPQTRDGKTVMTQKETEAKDLKADQAIAVIYTGGDMPVLLSAVVTAAQATDKASALIIGKWEPIASEHKGTVEFTKDNKVLLKIEASDGQVVELTGTYKFNGDDKVEVELTFMGETRKEELQVTVTRDEMTTIDPKDKKEAFKRVK